MKYFTKSQVEELRKQLATLGVRDTDLPEGDALTGEEEVAIVQKGENRRVKIKDLFEGNIPADIIEHLVAGKSAYEIAVDNGFVGTEQEWLESLKGDSADLNAATRTELGGIKIGYSQNGKNYPVQLDNASRAFVNVPWESGGGDTPTPTPTTRGGYYELIFKTTSTADTPALPANGQELDTATGWNHYATRVPLSGDVVWMANRFVSGTGTYENWQGPWSITGPIGDPGIDGDTIEYIYAITGSESTQPTSPNSGTPSSSSTASDPADDDFIPLGWADRPTGVSSTNPVEWVAFRIKEHSTSNPTGRWTSFFGPTVWSSYGKNGTDGDGVEYIFYAGTELPSTNLPSTWTNDADFQTREYIRESAQGIWFDDPVDLNTSEYGMGTKQWVCVRKKYADPNATDATWHAYSEPALWSYYAQDGDAGTGVVADSDNDTIALSLKADGYNNELTQQSVITIYNGATAVATTVTNVSVKDSLNNTYPSQTWITYSGNTVTAAFPEDAINLSDKQLLVTVTATAVIDGEPVTRNIVLTILGVHFGSDGASYRLQVSNRTIHKTASQTSVRASIMVWGVAVKGTSTINTYTPSQMASLGFTFKYTMPGMASEPTFTSTTLTVNNVTNYVEIRLYYGSVVVDREVIYVISDGLGGGYYESIFRAVAKGSATPTLPTNGIALPAGSPWAHSAQNSDGSLDVWMASRWVNGDGTYDDWQGPWIISGSDGDAGIDGDTHEYIYAITTNETVSPADPNSGTASTASQARGITSPSQDDFVPEGWTDSPQSIDENNRVEWVSIRTKEHSASNPSGTWTAFSTPVPWSSWGRTGTDGDGVEYIYYAGTTYPAVEPSSWSITNTEYQNTREYIATGSGWVDNPVNLDAKNNGVDVYPAGSKQWVCVRKKYADSTPHATFGTNPYWHAYTSPALWSYKAKDGDTGLGVVADLDNDMMAVALKQNGMNYTFSQEAEVSLYNGAAEVPCTITDVQVIDSDGVDVTDLNYVVVADDIATVNIVEDAINLSQKHLLVYLTVEGNVTIGGTTNLATRTVTLTIIGVHFGSDGASYRLVTTAPVIRKSANDTLSPSQVNVFVTKTSGTSEIESFTPSELIAANRNFRFKYAKNNSSQETSFTTDYVSTSGVTSNLRIELDYVVNGSEVMVDQETIPVIVDGTNGENAGRLDLDNENDSILYDSENNKISDSVVSTAKLYIGSTDMTSSATNWSVVYTGCSGSNSNNVITVTDITRSAASARISCVYDNVPYSAILSLKKIVGTVKYDLLVSPTAISYDPVSDTASSATVDVYVYRTSQQGRTRIASLPSGYVLKVDGNTVTYGSSGYNFNVNTALRSHTVNLWNGSELIDEETIPIVSGADPSSIEPAVAPFRGEFSLSETYYGSKDRTDIVYDSSTGTYYIAKQSAPSSPFTGIPLSNTNYWKAFGANYENIATGFLFAERLVTQRLETVDANGKGIIIRNNVMSVSDNTGATRLNVSGDPITPSTPAITYPTSGASDTWMDSVRGGDDPASGSDSLSIVLCNFSVDLGATDVVIPALTVFEDHAQFNPQFGSIDPTSRTITIKRGSTVVRTLSVSSSWNPYAATCTWTTSSITLSSLASGAYTIVAECDFNYSVGSGDPYYDDTIAMTLTDTSGGAVSVSYSDAKLVQIGSNGLSIFLGSGFEVSAYLDNGVPNIRLLGRNSQNNQIGLMITASGGVQVNNGSGWKTIATTN